MPSKRKEICVHKSDVSNDLLCYGICNLVEILFIKSEQVSTPRIFMELRFGT